MISFCIADNYDDLVGPSRMYIPEPGITLIFHGSFRAIRFLENLLSEALTSLKCLGSRGIEAAGGSHLKEGPFELRNYGRDWLAFPEWRMPRSYVWSQAQLRPDG